mgnify:FL=1
MACIIIIGFLYIYSIYFIVFILNFNTALFINALTFIIFNIYLNYFLILCPLQFLCMINAFFYLTISQEEFKIVFKIAPHIFYLKNLFIEIKDLKFDCKFIIFFLIFKYYFLCFFIFKYADILVTDFVAYYLIFYNLKCHKYFLITF